MQCNKLQGYLQGYGMVNDMDGYDYTELKKCREALERIAEALEHILREVDTEAEADIKEKLRG